MRIDLRDERRQRLFSVEVDLLSPPAVVRPPDGQGPAVHLDWDRALDDEHHLRRCPACGCVDLFARKRLPQLTAFALLLLAAVVVMLLLGVEQVGLVAALLGVMLVLDVGIFLFSPRELVCYRCHSVFRGVPIRRDHPGWQSAVGERYRLTGEPPTAEPEPVSDGEGGPSA